MLEGRAITIFGDGNDQRDYIYIADFIDGVITLADSNLPGPYNIGTGYGISVNEIHNILSEFIPAATPPKHGPPRAGDIPQIWLDVTSARKRPRLASQNLIPRRHQQNRRMVQAENTLNPENNCLNRHHRYHFRSGINYARMSEQRTDINAATRRNCRTNQHAYANRSITRANTSPNQYPHTSDNHTTNCNSTTRDRS